MTFDPVLQVRAVLEEGMKAPVEYIKLFDKYQPLITREVRSSPLMVESQCMKPSQQQKLRGEVVVTCLE